jgi:predicted RNase H-like nuclease (RuvC/YqgF family)
LKFKALKDLLSEKDSEIEQLKQYACQCEASVHSTQQWCAELQVEIERLTKELAFETDMASQADVACVRLKALLTRAADALETYPVGSGWNLLLIDELRKAAGTMTTELYLIWSNEHSAWWGPGQLGYVTDPARAGRYTLQQAKEICFEANRYAKEPQERMVAAAAII